MKSIKSLSIFIVFLVSACVPIPQKIDGIEIRGEVFDNETATPLSGAKVRISCAEKFGVKKAYTDSNGKFRVSWGSHFKLYRNFLYSKKERAKRNFEGTFKREGYEGEEFQDTFTPREDMSYVDFGVVYLEPKR